MPPITWKRYPSDKPDFWMEAALDGDTLLLRGPKEVMDTIKRLIEKSAGDLEARTNVFKKHKVVFTNEDGLVWLSGPKKKVLALIKAASREGPGPLERLFMED